MSFPFVNVRHRALCYEGGVNMKEHTNLYRIFMRDQQAHHMSKARANQILAMILRYFRESYDTS